jgi:hypothetical protein
MSYNFSPKIVTDGLVLYLDAANSRSIVSGSTTWTDLSKNGNNGTLVGGPTFSSLNGGSIVFDGSDDYVSTSYFGSNSSNYTFSVWYNPLGNVNTVPLGRGRDGKGAGWSVTLGSDNTSGNRYRAGVVVGGVGYIAYSTSPMTLNQWVYLTGVLTIGGSLNLYVNGIFNNSIVVPSGTLRTSTDGWVLGSITTINYYNSQVSTVQIYNRALSSSEVLQNYNTTKSRFGLS